MQIVLAADRSVSRNWVDALLLPLFSATLFLSSALLFLLEPMFAKMALPLLGGSPAVWNTCVLFFQAALVVAYLYAHGSAKWIRAPHQKWIHAVVLAAPLVVLPVGISADQVPPSGAAPALWLLGLLIVTIGPPFLAVATSAPLLQHWFARTRHPSARDPYFLYQASNLGSFAGLLAYPFAFEPTLRLVDQSRLWAAGYAVLIALTLACAWAAQAARDERGTAAARAERAAPRTLVDWPMRLGWIARALVPSSLLLGVTSYISLDIAPIPLFWVLPLALYLLTFVVAFSERPIVSTAVLGRLVPIVVLPLLMSMALGAMRPLWLLMPLHLVAFVVAALTCHRDLAERRPSVDRLTEFYCWIAVGGAIGGLFNALLAPRLFTSLAEYPLMLVLACAVRPVAPTVGPAGLRPGATMRFSPAKVRAGTACAIIAALAVALQAAAATFPSLTFKPFPALIVALPLLLAFPLRRKAPLGFAAVVGAVMLATQVGPNPLGTVVYAERSFFGVHRVRLDGSGQFHALYHGRTMHGAQHRERARMRDPITYYTPHGPIGRIVATRPPETMTRVAVIGLGTGTLATYARAGQQWTFYEIDPTIERIASDPRLFTFLSDTPARVKVELGDARISLRQAPAGAYGFIVLDAFSSDAIPLHLLTREALQLYLSKLAPGGTLALNVSNRYLDLRSVLRDLADERGLVIRARYDPHAGGPKLGHVPSVWVAMARDLETLGPLASESGWIEPPPSVSGRVWTDDYSNLLSLIIWR